MNRTLPLFIIAGCLFGMTACTPKSPHQELKVESATFSRENNKPDKTGISHLDTNDQIELKNPLPLSQAISLVLMHNPDLKTYSWDIRSAEARQAQARLRPNPELTVSMEEFAGRGPRKGFDGMETTVAVTQPIETGGKRGKRSQVASMEKKLAQWDYEMTRLGVIKQTQHAFTEVSGMQQRISLAKNQMSLAEQLLGTVNQRVEAGKDSPSEAAKAQIEFSHAQLDYQQAISDWADAKRRLAILWGSNATDFEQVTEQLDIPAKLPPLAQLRQQAHQHPQVLRWQDRTV